MKNRISIAALALALSAGSALAADLPSRKAPPVFVPPPPVLTWNGFYVGANVGGASGDGLFGPPIAITGASFVGGLTLGYNWQLSPNLVVGFETDADYRSRVNASVTGFSSATSSTDGFLGTARGRLGYSFGQLLGYVTGGLAYGNVIAPTSFAGPTFAFGGAGVRAGGNGSVLPGWTVGAGLEYLLIPNWSVKAEYLYAQLQHDSPLYQTTFWPIPIAVGTRSAENVFRAGVNYHFNWAPSAPIIAKF